jgi:uncharacterized protein YciI
MKNYLFLLSSALLLSAITPAAAQSARKYAAARPRAVANRAAASADQKTYYLVLLKAARAQAADLEAAATTRAAHMAYLQQLGREGKLALAGSCPGPGQELQTMYLLNVASLDEAQALSATDPCVKMGQHTAEVHPWVRQQGAKL